MRAAISPSCQTSSGSVPKRSKPGWREPVANRFLVAVAQGFEEAVTT
jgi:hypothetical protein